MVSHFYPSPNKGDTIKATYLIHIFPVVAILFGLLLEKMKRRNYLLSRAVLGALLVIAIHNLPAMVTHYPMHFGR